MLRKLVFAGLLLVLSAAGCSRQEGFKLYCGAGLQPPVAELVKQFEQREGVRVDSVYSGSGILLAQAQTSQMGDIYLPGDQFFMKQAEDKGLITKQAPVAMFVPVIAVQKGNPKDVKGLKDLTRADLKVGLGDARAAAVGRSAAAMLKKAGIAGQVKPTSTTPTVNQLATEVSVGALDAAVVWDAVARFFPDKIDIVPIAPEYRETIIIPVGILKSSKHPALAQKFVDFITGPQGRAVFKKHGYTLTEEQGS